MDWWAGIIQSNDQPIYDHPINKKFELFAQLVFYLAILHLIDGMSLSEF